VEDFTMRWLVFAFALAVVAGCEEKRSPTSGQVKITEPPAAAKLPIEPEPDSEPVRFDPSNAVRTLRWAAAITEPFRLPNSNRGKASDQAKAIRNAVSECLGQTVTWKVPVEKTGVDGSISFLPVRTRYFTDRSDAHPEMTLRIRPWNTTSPQSVFLCPALPELHTLRAGQDSLTVQGRITEFFFRDLYDWYVSLADVQFAADASTSLKTETFLTKKLDSADADQSFTWLRNKVYSTFDPFTPREELKRRKNDLASDVRSLIGTKVSWRWPATVTDSNKIVVEDMTAYDYSKQIAIRKSLLLKQPGRTSMTGVARVVSGPDYDKVVPLTVSAEAIAKIRETKKLTLKGKISAILDKSDSPLIPRSLEMAVALDDVSVEP
jgi:hypothetical protein